MTLDGMQRVLEQHAALLKEWRRQLADLESGRIRHATKGPGDREWRNDTDEMIAALRRDIATLEAIDKQYRP